MSVKRYEWVACDEHSCHCDVVESTEGDMVDYEDYAALEQKLAESQREFRAADATIENLQMQLEKLAAENAGLKSALECVINPDNQPEYHDQGMGCGVEDRGYQSDGYSACYYGWESAMERVYSEVIPDAIPETPSTDTFLAEVRTNAIKSALNDCTECLDRDCIMDLLGISYEDAALRESGAMALHDALLSKQAAQ